MRTFGWIFLFCLLVGCRPTPPKGVLSGQIRVGGEPLTGGSVMVLSEHPRWATVAMVDPQGRFRVDDVPVGPLRLGVRTRGIKTFDGTARPIRLPRRYEDPSSSGILVQVQEGEQEVILELPDPRSNP
jgi:hypothetical protein